MPTASMIVLVTTFTLIFALYFYQLFFNVFHFYELIFSQIFGAVALLSLIVGFIGAFEQKVLKKFFIYSSIGHVAFLLINFMNYSLFNQSTNLIFYLIVYLLSTSLLWFLVTFHDNKIDFLTNLLRRIKTNPVFYLIFVVIIFSMSGIPPLAGFYVKFDVFYSLIKSNEPFLLFLSLLITVASFYYYLRLLKIATFEKFEAVLLSNSVKSEKIFQFARLAFICLMLPFLMCYPLVIEQSCYYLFSNSNLF